MKILTSSLCLLAYVIPALMALFFMDEYGIFMSSEGRFAIWASVFASILGYVVAGVLSPQYQYETYYNASNTDRIVGFSLVYLGLVFLLFAYSLIGNFPLLSAGSNRVALTKNIFWNLNVLCMTGLFLYSRTMIFQEIPRYAKLVLAVYFIFILLSAWKGAILLFLIFFFVPKFKVIDLSLRKLALAIGVLSFLFISQQMLRSSEATLAGTASEVTFYLSWGFVNFDAEAVGFTADCIHSIPLIGCKFGVENSLLINPTWNVFTALSPIYIDGGVIFVSVFFFFAAFFLRRLEQNSGTIVADFIYVLLFYFFTMAHNGYVFYSKSLFLGLTIFAIVQFLKLSSPQETAHLQIKTISYRGP